MYILTAEFNAYDQHGEYFVAAFLEKPSVSDLQSLMYWTEDYCELILAGGGRKDSENEWYWFHKYEPGTVFQTF